MRTVRVPPYRRLDSSRGIPRTYSWRMLGGIVILVLALALIFRESQETTTYRGIATVQRKYTKPASDGKIVYFVELKIDTPWATGAVCPHPVEQEHWAALPVGAKVAVLYQRSTDGNAVRVLECGLVALP